MSRSPLRVLICEDASVAATLLEQELAKEGIVAEVLASAERLLEAARAFKPDCIVLDLGLPDVDGFAALGRLQADAVTAEIPVVVFSVRDSREDAERALALGAQDYLTKDTPLERVRERIVTWAQRGRKRRLTPRYSEHLARLFDMLGRAGDAREAAGALVELVAERTRADRVSVILFEPEPRVLVASDRSLDAAPIPLELDAYPELRAVRLSGTPLILDAGADLGFNIARLLAPELPEEVRTRILYPLIARDTVVGALFIRCRRSAEAFTPELLRFVQAAAAAAGPVIGALVRLELEREERVRLERRHSRARRELRQRRRFELFFNQVADGLVILDREGRILEANRRILRRLGWRAEEIEGRFFAEFVVPDQVPVLERLAERWREGREPQRQLEVTLLDREGRHHPFEVTLEPLPGQPPAVIADLRDLGRLKQLNRELQRAKLYLENIIQSSPDAVIAADTRGRIVLFNASASLLTEWTWAQLQEEGLDIRAFYRPGEAEQIMRELRRDRRRGGKGIVRNRRTLLVTRGGREVPILLNAALLVDEEGNEMGSVGIFTDVRTAEEVRAELREAREALIESERQAAVTALAGATAHHLNQPLTAVLGYVQFLRRRYPELTEEKAVVQIEEAANRMAEIVREIGRITRFEVRTYGGERDAIIDLAAPGPSREQEKGGSP